MRVSRERDGGRGERERERRLQTMMLTLVRTNNLSSMIKTTSETAFTTYIIRLAEYCFTSTETVGLIGTGAQDGHLDFQSAPEL